MNAQLTKRALAGGLGVGTLALMASNALAQTPFSTYAFPATGTPASRTVPDRFAEILNVKDYGAVGDGVTDDTVAVQATINAALALRSHSGMTVGATVFFPRGEYLITSSLTAANPGYSSNIRLVGEEGSGSGGASTLKGNFNGYVINKPDDGGVTITTIEGLCVLNYWPSSGGGGIRIDRAANGVIRNCLIQAFNALHIGSPTTNVMCFNIENSAIVAPLASGTTGAVGAYVGQVSFYNCSIVGWDKGIVASNVGTQVMNSRLETNNTGIVLGEDDTGAVAISHGPVILGNSWERNNTAIYIRDAGALLIAGNSFTGNANVSGTGTPSYGLRVEIVVGGVISGNTFGIAASQACIDLSAANCSNVVFEGDNAVINPGGTGSAWKMPATPFAADIKYISCNNPSAAFPFSGLPGQPGVHLTAPIEGMEFDITDSTTSTWGATAAGGGSSHVKVRFNGARWTVTGA
jgi:hypothetical protein